jgi:PTH1 family peptidyl-tRNA hydrolase
MEQIFDIKKIKVIIGLGNPGSKYHKNRHNIGFRILDALADRLHVSWQMADNMERASVRMPGLLHELWLVRPQTFMNNSGAVLAWFAKKGVKPDEILVVHDELEKSFGQHAFKFGGSHRGHNGLRSIMGVIGADFWRLRFGIGRPVDKNDVPDYVLTNFSPAEESEVALLVERIVTLVVGGLS